MCSCRPMGTRCRDQQRERAARANASVTSGVIIGALHNHWTTILVPAWEYILQVPLLTLAFSIVAMRRISKPEVY